MKKTIIVMIAVMLFTIAAVCHAYAAGPTIEAVRIGLITYWAAAYACDDGSLHIQYFEPYFNKYLGEEVFKEGVKILDTFEPNDD